MLQEVFCEVRRTRSSCVSAPQHACPPASPRVHFLGFSAWPKVLVKYLFRS